MKINNVSAQTSIQLTFWMSFLSIAVTAGFIITYACTTNSNLSISGFFEWAVLAFQSLKADSTEEPWIPYIIFFILPFLIYAGLVGAIITRQKGLQQFNSKLNLKSVEFLQGRINFLFNRPQYNFSCRYKDIENLKLILHTVLVRTKYSSYPAVNEIELKFSVLNKKEFSLKNTPLNLTNTIYSIIDYSRSMQKFSYKFEGVGEDESVKERIEDYLTKGIKQILPTQTENTFKFMSIIFFTLGIIFLWLFKDTIGTGAWIFAGVVYIPFIAISFIFDIFLLADKIKERKYNL